MESVLFVCTGNICRSPMAHVILASLLEDSPHDVVVRSAGLLEGGYPSTREAIEVMRKRNFDLSPHRSTSLSEALEKPADLILGMASQHVREVVVEKPELFSRTFVLKELARRTENESPRSPDEPLQAYLDRVGQGRRASDLMGRTDDVADPIGKGIEVYERTAEEIQGLVGGIAAKLWP